jgi:hypothetical protein
MHYRNGREAMNGDTVIQIGGYGSNGGTIVHLGILNNAQPGNDYCNGSIAGIHAGSASACMVDCLHVDDLMALLVEKGLDKRPEGK